MACFASYQQRQSEAAASWGRFLAGLLSSLRRRPVPASFPARLRYPPPVPLGWLQPESPLVTREIDDRRMIRLFMSSSPHASNRYDRGQRGVHPVDGDVPTELGKDEIRLLTSPHRRRRFLRQSGAEFGETWSRPRGNRERGKQCWPAGCWRQTKTSHGVSHLTLRVVGKAPGLRSSLEPPRSPDQPQLPWNAYILFFLASFRTHNIINTTHHFYIYAILAVTSA